MKWRTRPFPWFDNMLAICGDVIARGRYAWNDGEFEEGVENEDEAGREEDRGNIDVERDAGEEERSQSRARSQSRVVEERREESSAGEEVVDEEETRAEKRRRLSAFARSTTESSASGSGGKLTGVKALDNMNKAIDRMSERMLSDSTSTTLLPGIIRAVESLATPAVPKKHVADTLKGQTMERMQEEACVTEEGLLVMLKLLARPGSARIYMALKTTKLRSAWIRRMLGNYIERESNISGRSLLDLYKEIEEPVVYNGEALD